MNAVNQIPEHQKPAFMASLEAMQTKDSLRMYNDLVERCYLQCVTSFRSQSLNETEKTCVASLASSVSRWFRVGFALASCCSRWRRVDSSDSEVLCKRAQG